MAERSPLDYGDRIGNLEHRLGSVESSLEGRISSVSKSS